TGRSADLNPFVIEEVNDNANRIADDGFCESAFDSWVFCVNPGFAPVFTSTDARTASRLPATTVAESWKTNDVSSLATSVILAGAADLVPAFGRDCAAIAVALYMSMPLYFSDESLI